MGAVRVLPLRRRVQVLRELLRLLGEHACAVLQKQQDGVTHTRTINTRIVERLGLVAGDT